MFTSVAGRAVVVTGGSRGIGKGIARAFAKNGAQVLIVGRDERAGIATANELSADGAHVCHVLGDVSVPSDCQRIADVAGEQLGGIDVLCANAGIDPTSPLSELTEAAIDRVLATNLKGCMLSVVACLPRLKLSGHGRIILTSSITGPITGFPAVSVYAASKAGQLGFMRAAALELAGSRITMNAVLPGTILTERIAGDAAFLEQVAVRVPLGRVGTVDDIGNTVLFLATDEAGYITGQTIVVDGGLVLPEFQSITLT